MIDGHRSTGLYKDRIKFFRDAFEEPYNLNNNLFVPVIPFTLQHLLDYVFR